MTPVAGIEPDLLRAGLAAGSGGMRRAALLVHSMAPIDRAWMLESLPPAQGAELRRLLEELKVLGIARDPSLIADATGTAHPPTQGPPHVPQTPRAALSEDDRLHALGDAEIDTMVRLLRAEPAGVVARWLGVADWPWRARVLAGLEPGLRRRVEALLPAATESMPPAMRASLVAAVSAGLRAPAPADTSSGARPGFRQALDRMLRGEWPPRRSAA